MLSYAAGTADIDCIDQLLAAAQFDSSRAIIPRLIEQAEDAATSALRSAFGTAESSELQQFALSATTALDDYVAAPDASFGWSIVNSFSGEGYVGIVLNMTSQEWRTTQEVNRTQWKHWLTLIIPRNIEHETALLAIVGGNNNSTLPPSSLRTGELLPLALETGTVVAELQMVPNQPLTFTAGGEGAGSFFVPGTAGEQDDLTFHLDSGQGGFLFSFGYFDVASVSADPVLQKRDYAVQAISNGTILFDERINSPGATATVSLPVGTELGFFLIPNDTAANFLADPDAYYDPPANSGNIGANKRSPLFSLPAANPGQLDQMLVSIGSGRSTLSFEDLTRIPGGNADGDFDDAVFSVDVELTPAPVPPGTDVVGGQGKTEDAIIAYTFDRFMATGDGTWPALLPMVKSAVRAMDAVQEFMPLAAGVEINNFVVTGASKRGWTTWLTAAVDALAPEPRVKAIMPLVIDVLNFDAQLDHHEQHYEGVTDAIIDGFSFALQDYTALDVIERRDTPEGQALAEIVDPYAYRDRLTMPKFIVNSTGDEFFVPDSSQFYLGDLPGQNYLRYVPNTGHDVLEGSDAAESILAFYQAILNDAPLPVFSWSVEDGGETIRVTTTDTPLQVNLWQATNYASRDFRRSVTGIPWESAPLASQGGGEYVAHVSTPNFGATAFMVELVFSSGGSVPFKFSTQVSVLSAVEQPPVEPTLVPQLLKDINSATLPASIGSLAAVGNTLFFTLYDRATGWELWKSDGTAQGTMIVKDIYVGPSGSYPDWLTDVNGTLYFSAVDDVHGRELWKSDGTAEGTMLVADVRPGGSYGYNFSSNPALLTAVNGTLYFTAFDGIHGQELWKSDGTAEGTMLVADIRPVSSYGGNPGSYPSQLTAVGDTLYFTAYDGVHGQELWKSDGATEGTMLVADIQPATPYGYNSGSNPYWLTAVGGRLYFTAFDGVHGRELWKSDGTAEGTMLVADIRPVSPYGYNPGSYPDQLTSVAGTVYFTAYDGVHGRELWKCDGAAEGTMLVADIRPPDQYGFNQSSYPSGLTDFGGMLFFAANDGIHGFELWKSDGSAEGTMLVADIWSTSPYGFNPSSYPSQLTDVGGTLYFTARDELHGNELWKTDGTSAATVWVKDIRPGPLSSYAGTLTNVAGVLFFLADDGLTGYELWKSDGTSDGTTLVRDFNTNTGGSYPEQSAIVNGVLFFTAHDAGSGRELWKTDGTAGGTKLVADIVPGSGGSYPSYLTSAGGLLYFIANDGVHGNELWKSDGTAEGTMLVADIRSTNPYGYNQGSNPSQLTDVRGTLFFVADDGAHGRELWMSDGTPERTMLVEDIRPGSLGGFGFSSDPQNLTAVGGTLYFTALSETTGRELWKSDGTAAGTRLVADVRPSSPYGLNPGSYPQELTNLGGRLYFTAYNDATGRELWTSDGTPEGTMLVADIWPASPSSYPGLLTDVGGTLYFTAYNGAHGRELWKSDGTPEGTVLVKDIWPGGGSYADRLTDVDGTLFFTAYHPSIGRELWTSDGTSAGTVPVKNIAPSSSSSYPGDLTAVNGTLYFTAYGFDGGRELWQSDGTASGTVMVADMAPGPASPYPSMLLNFAGTLLFSAYTESTGREPWLLVQPVTIDIRPGDMTNSINPNSRGALPVVIYSTQQFDASSIDPKTLTLAGAPVHMRGHGKPHAALHDFNGDGRLDLLAFFATDAMLVEPGDTSAVLEGKQFDGQRIAGMDSIRIVGGGHHGHGNHGHGHHGHRDNKHNGHGGNDHHGQGNRGDHGRGDSGHDDGAILEMHGGPLRFATDAAGGADSRIDSMTLLIAAAEHIAMPGAFAAVTPPSESMSLSSSAVAFLSSAVGRAGRAQEAAADLVLAAWNQSHLVAAEPMRPATKVSRVHVDDAVADPSLLPADEALVGRLATPGSSSRTVKKHAATARFTPMPAPAPPPGPSSPGSTPAQRVSRRAAADRESRSPGNWRLDARS